VAHGLQRQKMFNIYEETLGTLPQGITWPQQWGDQPGR
jgi:hypothetical protein